MPMIEGIPFWLIASIIGSLGSPGVILVFWFVDHRKMDRIRREDMRMLHDMREKHQAEVEKQRSLDLENLNRAMTANQKDVQAITAFYERNVELVKNYEKLADDLANIIHLNTQVQTQLVEQIRHNTFCPVLREKGPQG